MATKYYPSCGCFTRRVILGLVAPYNDSCPAICGTDIDIIGISDNFTDDGWYLQDDAPNIVYMESGIITETTPCESGLADFIANVGTFTAAPAVWHNDSWQPLITVDLIGQDIGTSFTLSTTIEDWFTNPCTGSVQISTDGGLTWAEVGILTNQQLIDAEQVVFDTTETDYIYRVVVTDTVTGCQYYNPAPDTGSPSYTIYYAKIQVNDPLFELFGSINAVTPLDSPTTYLPLILATMVDPYQSVAGSVGGIGIDSQGGLNNIPFYLQIIQPSSLAAPTELATVIDSASNPVDTSPQGTSNVIKNYVGTYDFVELINVIIDGFFIFDTYVTTGDVAPFDLLFSQYVRDQFLVYQLADSAFSITATMTSTQVIINITTALPMTAVSFDEFNVGATTVPLIEI